MNTERTQFTEGISDPELLAKLTVIKEKIVDPRQQTFWAVGRRDIYNYFSLDEFPYRNLYFLDRIKHSDTVMMYSFPADAKSKKATHHVTTDGLFALASVIVSFNQLKAENGGNLDLPNLIVAVRDRAFHALEGSYLQALLHVPRSKIAGASVPKELLQEYYQELERLGPMGRFDDLIAEQNQSGLPSQVDNSDTVAKMVDKPVIDLPNVLSHPDISTVALPKVSDAVDGELYQGPKKVAEEWQPAAAAEAVQPQTKSILLKKVETEVYEPLSLAALVTELRLYSLPNNLKALQEMWSIADPHVPLTESTYEAIKDSLKPTGHDDIFPPRYQRQSASVRTGQSRSFDDPVDYKKIYPRDFSRKQNPTES